jgi:hypothetical protein
MHLPCSKPVAKQPQASNHDDNHVNEIACTTFSVKPLRPNLDFVIKDARASANFLRLVVYLNTSSSKGDYLQNYKTAITPY